MPCNYTRKFLQVLSVLWNEPGKAHSTQEHDKQGIEGAVVSLGGVGSAKASSILLAFNWWFKIQAYAHSDSEANK
jgi:hypothetical protein